MTCWQVGMKAVCISEADWSDFDAPDLPVTDGSAPHTGDIGTVARVVVYKNMTFLHFHEWPPAGYLADEFRPVVDGKCKTDISIFHEILDQVSTGIHHDFTGEPDLPPPPQKQRVR